MSNDFEPKVSVGVCLKDHEFRVQYQNEDCKLLCSNMVGYICNIGNKGCVTNAETQRQCLQPGFSKERVVDLADKKVTSIIHGDGEKVYTFLVPLSNTMVENFRLLKESSLSPAELKIADLRLRGFSNYEICEKYCISYSTVKTHMNHILSKVPESLKVLLKAN